MRPLCQRLRRLALTGTVALRRVARVGTHDLCVRCVKAKRVTPCRDARSSVRCVKGYRVSYLTGTDASRRVAHVGTHDLCVRCVASKRVTPCRDARSVRPLYQRLRRRGFNGNGRTDRASLQRLLVPCVQTPGYTSPEEIGNL